MQKLAEIIKKINYYFFKIPQLIRYLLISAFNAVIMSIIFFALYVSLMVKNFYVPSLILFFVATISILFVSMKLLVFRTKGFWLNEYLKTAIAYCLIFALQISTNYIFTNWFYLSPSNAQWLMLTIVTIVTYIFLKYFSFNRNILSF